MANDMAKQAKSTRREFPAFPFDPYPIQSEFMCFLYDSLNKGGIAMLESPTGTGKTLSIICSALQWLIDRRNQPTKQNHVRCSNKKESSEDEPDWMRYFTVPLPVPEKRTPKSKPKIPKKKIPKMLDKIEEETGEEEDREFLLEDYESEDELIERSKRKVEKCSGCDSSSSEEEEELEQEVVKPKIYFASRTHSQLSQFVKEFKRTKFASEINVVCLGSRKNLCINPTVLKLGNANRINERCLELQKNKKEVKVKVQNENGTRAKKKISSGCPMLKNQALRRQFRNEAMDNGALDIEDLVNLGNKIGTCPYYGARDIIQSAELVILPYQSLLLRSARESLGLDLKGNIVIIDEAHNLADSLTSMYNSKITYSQLNQVLSHLEAYFKRFCNLLGAGNRRYVQTLIVLSKSFIKLLSGSSVNSTSSTMTINELLFSLDIDNINLVKLCQYVKESKIIHKVSGYGNKSTSANQNGEYNFQEGSIVSNFQSMVDILISLINNNTDGRILISKQKSSLNYTEEGYIKFVMLSGEKIFSEVIQDAQAVIMAGGTLQPIEETRVRLFPKVPSEEVKFFTCNHIVPPESILPVAVSRGPSGLTFDFSYNHRSSPKMIEELGRFLSNIVAVVPEGIVVFFASYEYEHTVHDAWKLSGILEKLSKKKQIFLEPKNSTDVESILKKYKEVIESCSKGETGISGAGRNGAILLAVVGGKISEGINFSDGMGRCVVMVGLPYPSPSDLELMERIKHIEGISCSNSSCDSDSGFATLKRCSNRGREYYENLCMKAVNQSIGRAIRHINDYAAMLLVDARYSSYQSSRTHSSPSDKLPKWIKDRLVCSTEGYGEVHRSLVQFFRLNKKKHMT
ncbi:ATP-dependent DNA helicase chl1 [Rhynchospora pubera]|uniref:ATP-dependent DNA helicase chl1 n=1 Tax=Rhynchospora pubera TaxID=906938 RepID=A0AAV8HRZ3_9POAL|nr:ATP-dependent DNA helicase chl1 [Rhynchospora pubera]